MQLLNLKQLQIYQDGANIDDGGAAGIGEDGKAAPGQRGRGAAFGSPAHADFPDFEFDRLDRLMCRRGGV